MNSRNLGPRKRAAVLPVTMALLFGAMLTGCQSPRQVMQEIADRHDQRLETLDTLPFPLLLATPASLPRTQRLRVYLEGDGYAWATPNRPSTDPTPRNLLLARLAFDDPTPSLYLARPCQFVRTPACRSPLWTARRFAPEVLDSLDHALSRIKARYGNAEFELVGYSGGGALALLLAARREDVALVQTLAGNVAPSFWVAHHGLSPLTGSLDPLDESERLASIPQRHLSGGADRVVPPSMLRRYRKVLGDALCLEEAVLPGVTHSEGWERAWAAWRDRPVDCRKP